MILLAAAFARKHLCSLTLPNFNNIAHVTCNTCAVMVMMIFSIDLRDRNLHIEREHKHHQISKHKTAQHNPFHKSNEQVYVNRQKAITSKGTRNRTTTSSESGFAAESSSTFFFFFSSSTVRLLSVDGGATFTSESSPTATASNRASLGTWI